MPTIQIRLNEIGDARRFYEILSNPNFTYFSANPKSVEDEENWLRASIKDMANGLQYNYSILCDGEVCGGVGVRINGTRKHIGEIGYFIEEKRWGQGIATEAVRLLEQKCFHELKLSRIEILMQPENAASEKVALKAGYVKEGLLRKVVEDKEHSGTMHDVCLYAKVL